MENVFKDKVTKLEIEKLQIENKHIFKLTFIICFTIICVFVVCGIAFGKMGIEILFYSLLALFVFFLLTLFRD